jgi:hypothetical protein
MRLGLFLFVPALAAGAMQPALAGGLSSTAEINASGHDAAPTSKEHGAKAGEAKEGNSKPKDEGGLFSSQDNLVPLPTVIAPVLVGERLTAHLYLFLAALTPTAEDARQVKMRLPYVQDAMVRDVYRNILVAANPGDAPDTKALLARLKDVINAAVGKPLVTELQVGRIDMAPY